MDLREGRAVGRLTGLAAAGVLAAALVGLAGYLGGAAGAGAPASRGEETIVQTTEPRAASRPPIDLAAPTAFETATFALG